MAAFTWTADFGARKNSEPTIVAVKFGDGYEGRYATGINTNPRKWDLTFKNRTASEADAIEAFLIARGGVEAFTWTGPRDDEELQVVCKTWSRTTDYPATDTLTATFEENFDPAV